MKNKKLMLLHTILHGIVVALAVTVLTWQYALKRKNCDCAIDANSKYIAFMCYYVMGVALFVMSSFLVTNARVQGMYKTMLSIISVLNTGLIIAFIVIGLRYLKNLHKKKCACALNDPRKKVLEAWIWTYIALFIVGFILIITSGVLLFQLKKKI